MTFLSDNTDLSLAPAPAQCLAEGDPACAVLISLLVDVITPAILHGVVSPHSVTTRSWASPPRAISSTVFGVRGEAGSSRAWSSGTASEEVHEWLPGRVGRNCNRHLSPLKKRDSRVVTGVRLSHLHHRQERLVFYCRTTSACTAPRTPRRTCCPYAYVLITVNRVSRSSRHSQSSPASLGGQPTILGLTFRFYTTPSTWERKGNHLVKSLEARAKSGFAAQILPLRSGEKVL